MLPTPYTAADQCAGSSRRPPGRSGTSRAANNARAWHHRWTGAQRGAIPITICSVGETYTKEKKGLAVLEAFLSLALLPLSLCVTCSSPSSIKGEAGCPRREDDGSPLYTAVDIKTHALTCLRSTRTSETWDLSLSRSFVTHAPPPSAWRHATAT